MSVCQKQVIPVNYRSSMSVGFTLLEQDPQSLSGLSCESNPDEFVLEIEDIDWILGTKIPLDLTNA